MKSFKKYLKEEELNTITIYTNFNNEKLFFINEDDIVYASPYHVAYIVCDNKKELNKFINDPNFVLDNSDKPLLTLSRYYYKEGDILFESDLRQLQKRKDADLILCEDESGLWQVNDEYWNFDTAIEYYDGNNQRIQFIEYDDEVQLLEDNEKYNGRYYEREIKIKYDNGEVEKISLSKSNTSGNLEPFYTKEID